MTDARLVARFEVGVVLEAECGAGECAAQDFHLANAGRLAGIPGVLIHGRLDVAGPLRTAWQLAHAWPDSRLVVLERDGHTSRRMFEEVFAATEAFAER